jgi:large subunit ribosomal protein L21
MYAIVITGGKQYRVSENDVIEVEKLNVEPGEKVELDVAFIADGSNITTDRDALAKARVFAEVTEHFKGEKALVFKFQKRKGYKRLRGHRQDLTRLRVLEISLSGTETKPAAKKTVEKTVKSEVAAKTKPAVKEAAEKTTKKVASTKASATKAAAKPAAEKTGTKTAAKTKAAGTAAKKKETPEKSAE